ncbi:hypothetical protein [Sphingomonas hengshuiensis]|uniref:hypothetical protein n=1 Tax=Sphingomonas hengshuiensis TaxID=1609977 RepID=UPI000B002657|nr:hypothetical protein [Sphingomonas hengshuiensis]
MSERFELFRLSVLERRQPPLFADVAQTREQYLRLVFGQQRQFVFYGTDFHFVPEPEQSREDVIMARIGRAVTVEENRPPEEGLAETVHDGWKASVVVIDPRHHDDGQKVAVAVDPKVGSPSGLIRELADAINTTSTDARWDIEVEPIVNAQSFWEFAAKNKGMITSLTFEFIAPNMFGGSDDLTEELRAFRNNENAEKVEIVLKSKEGLDTSTNRTKEAVDYAVQGCGTIKAKTKNGKRFNSTKKVETSTLDTDILPDEPSLVRLARLATRILGRE